MHDIFISYSSKDREHAQLLRELLLSAGLSVWIDQSGIDVSTSWSAEIVDAIAGCRAFLVLLSPDSIVSENVIKEVSLAASKKKKILPLDLEPVEIARELEYHLAGIQRAPMTNIDAIIRALAKLGLEATSVPQAPKIVKEHGEQKSVMILPFEDLSPAGDNGWFTDGIASELINSLSKVKAMKVIDWNTSSMLKDKKVRTTELAKEFSVRYFIEGQVRKFGDNIKITANLLDIETGDHLWQDSLKGTMNEIFDIQEQVAAKVTEGLRVHLSSSEQEEIKKKPTGNAEAYELWLKGLEHYRHHTRPAYERALSLYTMAVKLDPRFSAAYSSLATSCMSMYSKYDRNPALLERAASGAAKVREIEGETSPYLSLMSFLALRRNDPEAALDFALRATEMDTTSFFAHQALGFAYYALGRKDETIKAWDEAARTKGGGLSFHFNFLMVLKESSAADAGEKVRRAAEHAIAIFERHIRLNPDDYNAQAQYATALQLAGRENEALVEVDKLLSVKTLGGSALYDLACIYLQMGDHEQGLHVLLRAVECGYQDLEHIRRDPDLNPLRGIPEYEKMIKRLEENHA